ncbi:MAG: type VI secretion protein IcmF/TssM N-terminal domain-containing protein [Planctomycetota bacterium]
MDWLLKLLALPWNGCAQFYRGFLASSLSARIAWTVAIFQLFVVVLAFLMVLLLGQASIFQSWWSPGKAIVLFLLLLLVPILVYYAARLWLDRGETSRWGDIEAAWNVALVELSRQQVSLKDVPLFLLLGTDGQEQERSILQNAPINLTVLASPPGSAPLHFSGGSEAVFLCLSGVGQASIASERLRSGKGALESGIPSDRFGQDILTPKEREDSTERLKFVCELLQHAREPLAPINGVLAVVPLDFRATRSAATGAVAAAIGEDLATISLAIGLRFPVVVAASGLEMESAFPDLFQRIGKEGREKTIGQVFPINLPATPEQMQAVSQRACGALDDMIVAQLLDTKKIEDQPADRHLVGMVCRIRLYLMPQVTAMLASVLNTAAHGSGAMLAGCYLFSAGSTAAGGKHAFVGGIFDRLLEVQGDLDWTAARLARDDSNCRLVRVMRILDACMLAGIFCLLIVIWWRMA